MVGSSKKQKSSLRASSQKSRERHVSFAVPSVGENTTHTDEEAAAPGLQPPTSFPPATQQPCGAEATPGNHNTLYYGPTGAPMRSSTTALFESWSHDPFAERTTMAHGTYCVWPTPLGSRWPQTIRPFVPPEVVSEVSVDDDDVDAKAARTTLRNICIASSTAAILAVFLVLVLVAEFSLPHIDIATSEIPRVVDRFHSGDPGIAASLKHINTPEATRTAARPPTPSTSRPRRVTNRQRAFPTVPKRTATRTTRGMTKEKTSTRRPGMNKTLPHECSSHFYTYCTSAVREFYYSASTHACRSTEADRVHLCNLGSNRFPNLGSCLASCVHEGKGSPHDRCYEKALFGTCTR
ncbi:hypothetical protein HPB51_029843 [Rhipicephalus microplus]|uniref:Bovine pancreatic trypsin inhibitor n=1 Tax=Rhipicephalus microplus TaxID=6941 RepID=A0A9J6CSZ6_RHIMP|nr:hypothetical protein HPB51_029843 [Rhipicephalus microplus]